MIREFDRKIVFEDGAEYYGYSFGEKKDCVLEIVFNTSMVGYQEIFSDPSYTDQAVVMTYPLIGNYGMADEDYETKTPSIGAFVVREYNDHPSSWRSKETLGDVMKRFHIPGVSGVDTRKITRSIRDKGSRRVMITSPDMPAKEAVKIIRTTPVPHDAVSRVSCPKKWHFNSSRKASQAYHVAAVDCGMKQNILRSLKHRGCDMTVLPYNVTAKEVTALKPDGVFISNGPGDPTDVAPVIELVKRLRGKIPIFGICLGHQLIALAYGAQTYKLKFGHRGGNHPVMNLATGKIEITSQNHSYAVDEKSLAGTDLVVTHKNILDGTIEGLSCDRDHVFSVQYHPESAPGPQDSAYLFDRFIETMEQMKNQ